MDGGVKENVLASKGNKWKGREGEETNGNIMERNGRAGKGNKWKEREGKEMDGNGPEKLNEQVDANNKVFPSLCLCVPWREIKKSCLLFVEYKL